MRRQVAGSALLAAAAAASAAAADTGSIVQRDIVDVAAPPGLSIREIAVDNRLGDVRVEGGDRDTVTVLAIKRGSDEDAVERLKVTLVPDPSGTIRIATSLLLGEEARPIAAGSVRVDLVVRTPRSALVKVDVWNGRLHVRDLDQGAALSANEGRIEVENVAGQITAHVARGDHDYKAVFGTLTAQGIRGDMSLHRVRGERLDISLHEGSVRGRDVKVRALSIITTDADVTLRGHAMEGGAVHIASFRGQVDVRLESEAGLELRAASRSGLVRIAGSALRGAYAGRGRYVGVVPWSEDPAAVELSSRVGNIRFAVVSP